MVLVQVSKSQGTWNEEIPNQAEEYKMTFNLKKAQNINNSVVPQSFAVTENANKYNLSKENDPFVSNFNTYLEEDRRPIKNGPMTHEAMLEQIRGKNAPQGKITEGGLSDSSSSLYPHRQYADGSDKFDVTPINMISEAYDKKFRDAFAKANKPESEVMFDKYVHSQMEGKPTKVVGNVPAEGSQLQANPVRFENLDKLPTDESAIVNRDNFDKKLKIHRMVTIADENGSMHKVSMADVQMADYILYNIYQNAHKQNRDLTQDEKAAVAGINKDKNIIIAALEADSEDDENDNKKFPGYPNNK